MSFGRTPGAIVRWLLAPIGWPTYFVFVLLAAVAMWLARQRPPARIGADVLLAGALWIGLGATQLVWLVLNAVVTDIYRRPPQTGSTSGRRWARLWTIYLLLTLPLPLAVPFRLNFALSRAALDRYAKASLAGDPATQPPCTVGGFALAPGSREVSRQRSSVSLRLTGSAGADSAGIAYDPSGLLATVPHRHGAGHLAGNWYWWDDGP